MTCKLCEHEHPVPGPCVTNPKCCPQCGGDPLTDEAIEADDPFEGTDNPCTCAPMHRGAA